MSLDFVMGFALELSGRVGGTATASCTSGDGAWKEVYNMTKVTMTPMITKLSRAGTADGIVLRGLKQLGLPEPLKFHAGVRKIKRPSGSQRDFTQVVQKHEEIL